MCGYMTMDRIRNGAIKDLVKLAPIEDKVRKNKIQMVWLCKKECGCSSEEI